GDLVVNRLVTGRHVEERSGRQLYAMRSRSTKARQEIPCTRHALWFAGSGGSRPSTDVLRGPRRGERDSLAAQAAPVAPARYSPTQRVAQRRGGRREMTAFIISRIHVDDYETWRPMFDQDRPRARE